MDGVASALGIRLDPFALEDQLIFAWSVFTFSVSVLFLFDFYVLYQKQISVVTASCHCCFWIAIGFCFNFFIWQFFGMSEALGWLNGYVLEYLLSFDNIFFFHLIFRSYRTPAAQVHRGLFFGIAGAVLLRIVFFAIGTGIFNITSIFRLFFGGILLYSGVKTFKEEDNDDDPRDNWIVQNVSRILPIHDDYADDASFFVFISPGMQSPTARAATPRPSRENSSMMVDEHKDEDNTTTNRKEGQEGTKNLGETVGNSSDEANLLEIGLGQHGEERGRYKATLLFLVVLTLEVVDIVFAIDSVTAKISMVSQFDDRVDLFLNCSSSVFCMLTLRSLYAIVATMVHVFHMLKYGVGLILILIGMKLIFQGYLHVDDWLSCVIMLGIFLVSIVASILIPRTPHPKPPSRSLSDTLKDIEMPTVESSSPSR